MLDQKYGLVAEDVDLKLYANQYDRYIDPETGQEKFREASYYATDDVIGINLSTAGGTIINGGEYAERKAHENAESRYDNHTLATIKDGAHIVPVLFIPKN